MQEFSEMASHMFQLEIPVLEKIIRPILVYGFLVIVLRIASKRELGQNTTFDLVVLLMLSNTVQNAIIGQDNSLLGGLIGATALIILNELVARILYKQRKLSEVLEGSPDLLIENGQIQEEHLNKECITLSQLEEAARLQGYDNLDELEKATLEIGGGISFVPKKPTDEVLRHKEIMKYLKSLEEEMTRLRESSLRPKNE